MRPGHQDLNIIFFTFRSPIFENFPIRHIFLKFCFFKYKNEKSAFVGISWLLGLMNFLLGPVILSSFSKLGIASGDYESFFNLEAIGQLNNFLEVNFRVQTLENYSPKKIYKRKSRTLNV